MAVFACVFWLSACATTTPAPQITASHAPTDEVAVQGGTLQTYIPMNVTSLHPLHTRIQEVHDLLGLVFEDFIYLDETGKPSPGLAERWEQTKLENGNTQWTFYLRKNVKWHGDYGMLTAQDVVFTLNMIKSLGENNFYYHALRYMLSYEAVDNNTLHIITSKPFYGLLNALALPILPQAYYQTNIAELGPQIGSGPYCFTNYDAKNGLVLSVNDDWWRTRANIDRIHAIPATDNDVALGLYATKKIDLVITPSFSTKTLTDAGDTYEVKFISSQYEFLAPNCKKGFFQDKRIRRALAYAVDCREIISKVYLNHAIAADVPIQSNHWLFDPSLTVAYDYNPTEAKRLLANAGYTDTNSNGTLDYASGSGRTECKLRLVVNKEKSYPLRYEMALMIKDQLSRIGITVEIDAYADWQVYVEKIKNRDFDLLLGALALSNIPDLTFLLGSNSPSGTNLSGFGSSSMDKALTEVLQSGTEETLKKAFERLEGVILEEVPYISLAFTTRSLISRNLIVRKTLPQNRKPYFGFEQWYIRS